MLYQIIVRNGSANHYASSDNQTCAHTIFNALTKTFLHVELWQGATLVQKYDNSSRAIDAEHDEVYDEFGVNTKNTFNTAPNNG